MEKQKFYSDYLKILEEELVPAYGCTEPIALAYTAAVAKKHLPVFPEKIKILCSGNIVKNCKSVIIPPTTDLMGMEAAVLMGTICGDPERGLEVIAGATDEQISKVRALLSSDICEVGTLATKAVLHIKIYMEGQGYSSEATLIHTHTGVVEIKENDSIVWQIPYSETDSGESMTDRSVLSVSGILDFATKVDLEDVRALLERQINYNMHIAEEGILRAPNAVIGKTLYNDVSAGEFSKAIAYTAAGSEMRMNGCGLPVVTNSGSGNQGITISVPLTVYAREKNYSEEQLFRALVVANLISVHIKTGIGRLSAFCGAVSAACGTGAGLTFLSGGGVEEVNSTITNTLGNVSGLFCDGAKSSCALKIAASLNAAVLAYRLSMKGYSLNSGDGIVKEDIEKTIGGVGVIGSCGMKQTDETILNVMLS